MEDQKRFFGRDYETEEILALIVSHPLVLVYAQSGAGKTSLFNAQIIPALEAEEFQVLPIARVGINPHRSSIASRPTAAVESSASRSNTYILNTFESLVPNIDQLEMSPKSLSEFLEEFFPVRRNKRGDNVPQVIIFDQLEEIFTFYPDDTWQDQQKEFFEQIAEALSINRYLRIVFVIREDYLAQFDPFAEILPGNLRHRFRLLCLCSNAAIEAIKGPLRMANLQIDEHLIESFMEEALRSRRKEPVSDFCRWSKTLLEYTQIAEIPSVFDKSSGYKPTPVKPLVYHLYGDVNIPQSMVLTEKDYIDFVINLNRQDEKVIFPAVIRKALAISSLLFIGYNLEDVTFRTIFEIFLNLGGVGRKSIACLLPPYHEHSKQNEGQAYLSQYTKRMFQMLIYWGDISSLSKELRKRWDDFKSTTHYQSTASEKIDVFPNYQTYTEISDDELRRP